jgi:hypothetical protein
VQAVHATDGQGKHQGSHRLPLDAALAELRWASRGDPFFSASGSLNLHRQFIVIIDLYPFKISGLV